MLNLYQKIVELRKVAEGFNKDGASYGYKYVTGNQVLGKIKDKMNELNLLLIPSTTVGEHSLHAYKTAKGKDALDFVVKGEMSYTWINGDDPAERETASWAYYGQQDEISKAYGSGLTYSERYFLLKCLGLPTDEDDPDARQPSTPITPTATPSQPPIVIPDTLPDSAKAPIATPLVTEGQVKLLNGKATAAGFKKEDNGDLMEAISIITGRTIVSMIEIRRSEVNNVLKWLTDYTQTDSTKQA